jgi:hypothetical protein
VSPFVVARDPQSLEREDPGLGTAVQGIPGRVRIETRAGFPALTLWHNGVFMPARVWQRQLHYPLDVEAARSSEDALVPGHFKTPLSQGGALHIVASVEDDLFRALAAEERLGVPPPRTLAECVAAIEAGERERLDGWRRAALEGADFTARQAATAHGGDNESLARRREPLVDEHDPLVVPLAEGLITGLAWRGPRLTVLESLPSGIERGESALRAVPGLVAIRAFDAARQVLSGYLDYLDEGVAPSSFDPLDGHPLYGDPAPSLWLIHATDLYVRRSGETELLADRLFQPLESIMQSFRQGTRHGITVDRDGLLATGAGGELFKRSDHNALWYHALVAMSQLAKRAKRRENAAFYMAWARELQRAYVDRFWDDAGSCLFGECSEGGTLRGVAPSQLYAISLPPMLLPPELSMRLVDTLTRELFTPRGLHPRPGDGTPEPAWLGPWASAMLRAHARDPRSAAHVHAALSAYADHGEGSAAELTARGAADLLRAWIEEVDHAAVAQTLELA